MKKAKQKPGGFKQMIFTAVFAFVLTFTLLTPAVSAASLFSGAKKEACAGAQLTRAAGANCTKDDQNRLSNTIRDGINFVSVIVGIIAVIMIIIGGIRFVVSNGDSAKVTSARNTIIYALIGLILVAFAQVIVKFVLTRF